MGSSIRNGEGVLLGVRKKKKGKKKKGRERIAEVKLGSGGIVIQNRVNATPSYVRNWDDVRGVNIRFSLEEAKPALR